MIDYKEFVDRFWEQGANKQTIGRACLHVIIPMVCPPPLPKGAGGLEWKTQSD
jgi:hypothetical protein